MILGMIQQHLGVIISMELEEFAWMIVEFGIWGRKLGR